MSTLTARTEAALRGQPEHLLTLALLGAGVLLWMIALDAPATLKAVVLAWILVP